MTEINEALINLVHKVKPQQDDYAYEESTRFVEDLGFGSVNSIMLVTLIEKEFSIDMGKHMEDLVKIQTIGAASQFIDQVRQ